MENIHWGTNIETKVDEGEIRSPHHYISPWRLRTCAPQHCLELRSLSSWPNTVVLFFSVAVGHKIKDAIDSKCNICHPTDDW